MTFRMILDDAAKFIIPLMIVLIPLYGLFKRVAVYEEFINGAKEGFSVAVRIIPYLVAILFAIGMFRASGAMDWLIRGLRPVLGPIGIPPEILPMAITRPLSGSGSLAILTDLDKPDDEIDHIWALEARKRWDAYKAGRLRTVSYEELMSKYNR